MVVKCYEPWGRVRRGRSYARWLNGRKLTYAKRPVAPSAGTYSASRGRAGRSGPECLGSSASTLGTLDQVFRAAVREVVREEVRAALDRHQHTTPAPAAEAHDDDVYVTVQRAAKIADVHPSTVRTFLREGALTRYAAGDSPRVKLSELHAYLARKAGNDQRIDLDKLATEILDRARRRKQP